MNDIIKIEINNIHEVMRGFESLPAELKAVTLDAINQMQSQLREYKVKAEALIIKEMNKDGASKLPFRDVNGNDRVATLAKGKMECKNKDIGDIYLRAGFETHEIGEWTFKPSWSKAKEARKFGGEKQLIIDEYFVEGKPSIKID